MPLSVQHSAPELASVARHAIDALFSAANYSDHRQARLAVREGVELYVHALRAAGVARDAALRHVAEFVASSAPSGGDGRYVQALRAELARWSAAAYDGR